jgi:hypothetical protein
MLAAKLLRDLWAGLKQAVADRAGLRVAIRRDGWKPQPGQPSRDCYFIALRNVAEADVLVTHVWFECEPRALVDRRQRRLPKTLLPGESWETWFEVARLPTAVRDHAFDLARVRLASGTVIKAERR